MTTDKLETWKLSTAEKKNVYQTFFFTKDDKTIEVQEIWRWGSLIGQFSEKPSNLDLANPNSYDLDELNALGWELDDLEDCCSVDFDFLELEDEEEQDRIVEAFDTNYIEGIKDLGWDDVDTEVVFHGELNLEQS
jgi:hypothetical protein